MIATVDDVKKLGKILAVWAHPDDETYCAGGLLATAVQNGQAVVCVTATRGERGVQDEKRWPTDQLADIRTKELQSACKILGLSEHQWLNFDDGACAKDPARGETVMNQIVNLLRPDCIITFGPDGLTGHPDHKAVSAWATHAGKAINIPVYQVVNTLELFESHLKKVDEALDFFYNIDQPVLKPADECDICFKLSDELCDKKLKALKSMPSQTEKLFSSFDDDFLIQAFGTESFVKAK